MKEITPDNLRKAMLIPRGPDLIKYLELAMIPHARPQLWEFVFQQEPGWAERLTVEEMILVAQQEQLLKEITLNRIRKLIGESSTWN
jgi:hypothetical protein